MTPAGHEICPDCNYARCYTVPCKCGRMARAPKAMPDPTPTPVPPTDWLDNRMCPPGSYAAALAADNAALAVRVTEMERAMSRDSLALREAASALGCVFTDVPGEVAKLCKERHALATMLGGTDVEARVKELISARDALSAEFDAISTPRPLSEWHEDDGISVWWKFPVDEPAWIGTPLDDEWPGYHTHWTAHPAMPTAPRTAGEE